MYLFRLLGRFQFQSHRFFGDQIDAFVDFAKPTTTDFFGDFPSFFDNMTGLKQIFGRCCWRCHCDKNGMTFFTKECILPQQPAKKWKVTKIQSCSKKAWSYGFLFLFLTFKVAKRQKISHFPNNIHLWLKKRKEVNTFPHLLSSDFGQRHYPNLEGAKVA